VRGVTALFLFAFASGQAQDSSTVTLDNGVQLKVEANFGDPTGQETLTVQLARANGNSFYRIFRDQNQLAVYAYKLVLELASDGSAVRATAQAYDDQFMQQFPNADGGKPTPTLAMERPLDPLGSGQSATLDLFEIPGVGLHVTETLSMQLDSLRTPGPLRFADLEVSVDGKVIPVAQQLPVSGRFAMFYLPGHGAFVFSATDVGQGFIKAGVIDGNRMEFNLENQAYDCAASQPILTRPETGQLWVLRLPDYQPEGNWTTHPRTGSTRPAADQFFAAASDSLSWWVQ
jgi:hypothetical protein